MGVYIPHMHMPDNCETCRCICSYWTGNENIWRCGLVIDKDYDTSDIKELYKRCPLIDIPTPHGNLKDEDSIIKNFVSSIFKTTAMQ